MTIQDTLDSLNKKQSEYGWTVLAQRVPQSEDAPHKIALVKDAIKPNEPIVLILPGTGAEIISCNGLLKRVHDFIKNNDKTCQARICIAIYDYEQKYIQNLARAALIVNKRFPVLWFLLKNIGFTSNLYRAFHDTLNFSGYETSEFIFWSCGSICCFFGNVSVCTCSGERPL